MRVGIIVVLGFACVFGWVSRGVGEDLRALVQAAARSSRDRLRSGIGKGVMRGYDKAGRKAYEMPFEAAFNGDKFNLKFDPKREDCGRSVIVSDTSAVSSREYFQGHGPDPVFVRGAGMLQSVQGYFPNEFFRFTAGALNPDQLDKYAVKIEKLSGGRLRGAYDHPNGAKTMFEASPEVAFNVTHLESYDSPPTGRSGWAGDFGWARDGGVWYVRKAELRRFGRGKTQDRREWLYDEFHANRELSRELFSLATFDLKAGDNVIDTRPGQVKVHPVDPAVLAQTTLDTMVRQMEEMPVRGTAPPPRPVSKTMLILAVNVVAAVVILSVWCLWYLFRQRGRVAGKPQSAR